MIINHLYCFYIAINYLNFSKNYFSFKNHLYFKLYSKFLKKLYFLYYFYYFIGLNYNFIISKFYLTNSTFHIENFLFFLIFLIKIFLVKVFLIKDFLSKIFLSEISQSIFDYYFIYLIRNYFYFPTFILMVLFKFV